MPQDPLKKTELDQSAVVPRQSRLATISLVLGLCTPVAVAAALFLHKKGYNAQLEGGLLALGSGLLAIIFGAIALPLIVKSQGQLKGTGVAIAGLTLGLVCDYLVVLVILAMFGCQPD